MDQGSQRLSALDRQLAALVNEAQQMWGGLDVDERTFAGHWLIPPGELLREARHLQVGYEFAHLQFQKLTGRNDQSIVLLNHMRQQLSRSAAVLWRACSAFAGSIPFEVRELCLALGAPASLTEGPTGVRSGDAADLARAAQRSLSGTKALYEFPAMVLPSRLSTSELLRTNWLDQDFPEPSVSRYSAGLKVLFEAPVELLRPNERPDDSALRAVAGAAEMTLLEAGVAHPAKRGVLLDGMVLYGGTEIGAAPAIELIGRASHWDLRRTNDVSSQEFSLTMSLSEPSIVHRLYRNVEAVLQGGTWTRYQAGALDGARLTDQSAMEIGRAITGKQPLASGWYGPVM